MKLVIVILLSLLGLSACTYERIFVNDVEDLLFNQLENNQNQIGFIKSNLRLLKIDTIERNVQMINRLNKVHADLLSFIDSFDRLTQRQITVQSKDFIHRNFIKLPRYQEEPFDITDETPPTLVKLHLATLEGFFLMTQENAYSFGDQIMSFGRVQPFIVTDKPAFKRGEKITGRVILVAIPDDAKQLADNAKTIRKIEVNGKEFRNERGEGRFELTISKVNGSREFQLTTVVALQDTVLESATKVFIRD